jgi:hypothetical protein
MSIENHLAALTAAVVELTAALKAGNTGTATVPQTSTPAPVPVAAAPVFAAPAAAMPAPPSFAAPAPVVQQASAVPFSDGQGLIAYVMDAYKSMGPTKGAGIQGVLTTLGYQNINDVKPEHYGSLYQGVEALKRG